LLLGLLAYPGARFGVAGGLAFGGGSEEALGTWDAEC